MYVYHRSNTHLLLALRVAFFGVRGFDFFDFVHHSGRLDLVLVQHLLLLPLLNDVRYYSVNG